VEHEHQGPVPIGISLFQRGRRALFRLHRKIGTSCEGMRHCSPLRAPRLRAVSFRRHGAMLDDAATIGDSCNICQVLFVVVIKLPFE
jgi:hypothetical protein